MIEDLRHSLGVYHHFAAKRSPWANGTVEVINKELCRVFRAFASELRIHLRDCPRLVFLVQCMFSASPRRQFWRVKRGDGDDGDGALHSSQRYHFAYLFILDNDVETHSGVASPGYRKPSC